MRDLTIPKSEYGQKNDNKDKTDTPSNINAQAEKKKIIEEMEEDEELENARLLSIQENNKIIQKENELKQIKNQHLITFKTIFIVTVTETIY